MKKKLFILNTLISGIIFSQVAGMPCFAQENSKVDQPKDENYIYVFHVKKDKASDAQELSVFLSKYLNDLNGHNIKRIGNYYASNYMSGDGFNKAQIIDLIRQTWEKCPDIKYSTSIKSMRIDGTRASIELCEDIAATTKDRSEITKDKGSVTGTSHNILYLEKYGNGWVIVTDKTLYEETTIKYGTTKNINVNLQTPEQVLAGDTYTASLKTDLPADVFALGSITSVPYVYPPKQPVETFRQIPSDLNLLERVLKSNKNCQNEIVSASISFCQAERTSYTSLDLMVSGITVIMKRVNVLPKK